MNKIYDNGALMLGNVQDILEYLATQNEDLELEMVTEIVEELEELENDIIVCVNYEHPMGWSVDYWFKDSIVKE